MEQEHETIESMARELEQRAASLVLELERLTKRGKGLAEGKESALAAQRLVMLAARDCTDAAVRMYTLIRQS